MVLETAGGNFGWRQCSARALQHLHRSAVSEKCHLKAKHTGQVQLASQESQTGKLRRIFRTADLKHFETCEGLKQALLEKIEQKKQNALSALEENAREMVKALELLRYEMLGL